MTMKNRLVTAYMAGDPEAVGGAQTVLMSLFSLLRAQHLMMWNHHWESAGVGAYGMHLLFERIYDGEDPEEDGGLQDDVDGLAEKLMGYFGPDAVNASTTLSEALQWLKHWEAEVPDCIVTRSLRSEQELQQVIKATLDVTKEMGVSTLGLDAFLSELSNRHETNIYLLQQLLDDPQGMSQKFASEALNTDEHLFFDNPQKREVREFADSKAISNDPAVAVKQTEEPGAEAVHKAEEAPPTVTDNLEQPGGQEFSTLNRFIVETAEPVPGVPEGHDEVDKHPILASWDFLD